MGRDWLVREQMRNDTQSGIDFLPYSNDRSYFNVVARVAAPGPLILRETHTVEAEVVSDFRSKIEPSTPHLSRRSADVKPTISRRLGLTRQGTTSARLHLRTPASTIRLTGTRRLQWWSGG